MDTVLFPIAIVHFYSYFLRTLGHGKVTKVCKWLVKTSSNGIFTFHRCAYDQVFEFVAPLTSESRRQCECRDLSSVTLAT